MADAYDSRRFAMLLNGWRTQEEDDGLSSSLGRLSLLGPRLTALRSHEEEYQAVNQLVKATWRSGLYRRDGDARGLNHIGLTVTKIERVENAMLYEQYKQEKRRMRSRSSASAFRAASRIPGSTGQIMTTKCMTSSGLLSAKLCPSINEYFLFHGTQKSNVASIVDHGFSMDYCRDRSLLGPALYFAESSTKADMYADYRDNRTAGPKQIILARVLLGDAHVHTSKWRQVFTKPPCRHCLQATCYCTKNEHYDSIIGDSSRPFRIFAVYESRRCYPEYVITYTRKSMFDGLDMFTKFSRASPDFTDLFGRAEFY